jgi:hypothetical protein
MNEVKAAINMLLRKGDEPEDRTRADSTREQRARLLLELEKAKQLLLELRRPECEPFLRFAVAWGKLERALSEVEGKLRESAAQKQSDTTEALFEKVFRAK